MTKTKTTGKKPGRARSTARQLAQKYGCAPAGAVHDASIADPAMPLAQAIRIDAPALVAVLQNHALGAGEMTATQVTVALALLKMFDVPQASHAGEAGTQAGAAAMAHEDALRDLE